MHEHKDDDSNVVRYDLCIIGRGMVGSAAARHAGKMGARVVVVGPDEVSKQDPPGAWEAAEIFGAHYDEGRITRKTDPDAVWAELAARSVDRYRTIAEEAGLDGGASCSKGGGFYEEVGHLAVGPAGSETVESRYRNATAMGIPFDFVSTHHYPTDTCAPKTVGNASMWDPNCFRDGVIANRATVANTTCSPPAPVLGCIVSLAPRWIHCCERCTPLATTLRLCLLRVLGAASAAQ